MAVLRSLPGATPAAAEIISALAAVPGGSFVYSHPRFSAATFTPQLARQARDNGCLPSGAKISKVTRGTLTELRAATSGAFTLWHGSPRDIACSLAAGASGVVLAALAHLPNLVFQRDLALLQRGVDTAQHVLDQLHRPGAKVDLLTAMTREQLEQSA